MKGGLNRLGSPFKKLHISYITPYASLVEIKSLGDAGIVEANPPFEPGKEASLCPEPDEAN